MKKLILFGCTVAVAIVVAMYAVIGYEHYRYTHVAQREMPAAEERKPAFRVALKTDKENYFQNDSVSEPVLLRITLSGSNALGDVKDGTCPFTVALHETFPDGKTQSDALRQQDMKCRSIAAGIFSGPSLEIEAEAGVFALQGRQDGDYVLRVSAYRAGAGAAAESEPVHIRNTAPLAPDWGTPAGGFAVSLSLDADELKPGEDAHLHIACKRLDKEWVMGGDRHARLCDTTVELREESGKLVEQSCAHAHGGSNGQASYHAAKDEAVPVETLLSGECMLPVAPGNYTLTAVGHLRADDAKEPVTVSSPVVALTVAE